MEHAPAADASFVLDKECDETEETEEDTKTEGAETKSARFCGAKSKSHRHTIVLAFCIFAVGTVCAVAFLAVGIPGLKVEQAVLFEKQTNEIVQAVQSTWEDYELVALWIHQSMRTKQNYSSFWHERQEFAVLSRYVQAHGVNPLSMGYVPNVTHAERLALEEESRDYYSQVAPELPYLGFTEWQANRSSARGYSVVKAPVRDVYFPQVLIEPLEGNEAYVDVDMSGSGQGALLRQALAEQKVVISPPFSRGRPDTRGKAVYLLHPGIPMDEATLPVVTMGANNNNETATAAPSAIPNRGLASVLIAFGPFMERVALGKVEDVSVYIYALDTSWGSYLFGGSKWTANCSETKLIPDPPSWEELSTSINPDCMLYRDLEIAQQKWRVVVVDDTRLYKANLTVTTLAGILMFVASLVLVTWFVSRTLRNQALVRLQEATRAEKAALILQNAQATVAAERQRNEYLAHEVRNPLAAALSACSFLETAHAGLFPRQQDHADNNTLERNTLAEQSSSSPITVVQAKEDLTVIKSSLTYINDLLRSMLDVNKIASRQLVLQPTPTDLYRDIIEPIRTILHRRDNPFAVEVECPTDLIVSVDRMRLKQIVLNLAANSKKFVQTGYIRLVVQVLPKDVGSEGGIRIAVEDSGPGIPEEKHEQLFQKFQESLDLLSQGTGMGLSLCQGLVNLMDGRLYLDSTFCSQVPGCRGCRFVVDLPTPPLQATPVEEDVETGRASPPKSSTELPSALPTDLTVLVVDDDTIVRKLLSRSIKRVAPGWTVQQAANGETALTLANNTEFDLIMMDQYMASVEQQLLGTETIQALRANGVRSRICGVSANEMESAFLASGANYFLLKPFSTDRESLERDLLRVLGIARSEP